MGRKRKLNTLKYESESESEEEDKSHLPERKRKSEDPVPKRNWLNKQRVLMIASRGLTARDRNLVKSLQEMMPHTKAEPKFDAKGQLTELNEIAESRNCNKVMYFECRRHQDMFLWLSDLKHYSVKFQILNVHTMEELNLTGNCLRTSRPILKFSSEFNDKTKPHLSLMKEMIAQTFNTPRNHPKSQPFTDHVYTFTWMDDKIWFRNYQIVQEDGELAEIGPRFVLWPIKILSNSFGGETLYENPAFKTPNSMRKMKKIMEQDRLIARDKSKIRRNQNLDDKPWKEGAELADVFA